MSHSVKELENRTGIRLLGRTTREVVLTNVGRRLVLHLERLLDELNNTLRSTGHMGQQLSGEVRVATSQAIPAHPTPQCVAEGHHRYPNIQFVLHDHPQQWMMESVRQGDADFGAVIGPGPVGSLQCEAVLSEPLFLLCHRDSTLTVEDYVPWQALQGTKLVLQDYVSDSQPLIDAALAHNGIQANIVQKIGHPATLFPMVATGISISILPALALSLPEGSPLVVRHITPVVERQLVLVCREDRSLSAAA